MIQAKYYRCINRLTITGHACAGVKGEDLVCSAASILVHTLATNVEQMADDGLADNIKVDVQEGAAEISCRAKFGSALIVANTFRTVCVGFEILAIKFPEYISFEIIG